MIGFCALPLLIAPKPFLYLYKDLNYTKLWLKRDYNLWVVLGVFRFGGRGVLGTRIVGVLGV